MNSIPQSVDVTGTLEGLIRTGQDAVRQFDDILAATAGVGYERPGSSQGIFYPFGLIADLQHECLRQVWRLWNGMFLQIYAGGVHSDIALAKGDKRFKDSSWREQPYYDLLKQTYLLSSRHLLEFVDNAQVDDRTRLQLRFYARQLVDAISPSNFPATNPEVIRKPIETRSASLTNGLKNLIDDFQKGRITRVDESAFEVGRNLATTPGTVIFENELVQLIQYAPQTSQVEKTPLLFVPPCINKYYLLDLGTGNSLVEYAVAQGHQVFLISWRSAVPETQHLTWDDYLEMGPLKAVEVVLEVTGAERTHALGFCVGGTLLSCAAAVMAARGQDRLATVTLLTTMLDFSDTGEIGLLIDAGSVALREATIGKGGIMPGRELAFTFGTLRANDLIWRYVVDNYLKGATPDVFDLLYWDSDSVSLPGPMYCWYTRNTYLENNLKDPGKTTQCGVAVDFSRITAPFYLLASREDHIVPWKTAFRSKDLIGGEARFVLAASGHVAGVINPPARNKRSHWLSDDSESDPEGWLDGAEERPGSWWPDWNAWLGRHSGGTISAPEVQGSARFDPIESAPGRYVKEKSN
ncbi:PHA/PHB synthase family protein [Bradyrhizobium sp. 6(2017)]|uniref:PHA/PHB synthase family protein n=1 Tax=Bradyrhizobium sp. 6(2017) TaxID=1197460 RepID=UPI0013E1D0C5|nr:class I poly(R)-hydroxyalkanoic acid synthase [Bradyrhizobium sp. 6(2017)]QIG94221.1 class I poly(R)-hydroxyalkanoic acid synthase [Bradyrhizobium sp. 6(2017)]